MSIPKVAAIIVASGRGVRAGEHPEGAKQFRRIGGRPILAWTLERLLRHPKVGSVVLVANPDDAERTAATIAPFDDLGEVRVVDGGATRQASVRNGLLALSEYPVDTVLIHDAVRPFLSADLIDRVAAATGPDVGALPVVPVADTLKKGEDGHVIATVDRSGLYAAQTPQGFPYRAIMDAHEKAANRADVEFTDDASIAEWAGLAVAMVEGEPDNVKLTSARDLELADRRLKGESRMIDVRTGNGYDVHKLVDGDHVILCGVRIPHDQTLSGHSDADVGFHALTDALLATCGAGDIGDHFPPSDPQWKGAASHIFLTAARDIVAKKGGRIMNADISLICEAPKIAPHRGTMRKAIADCLAIDMERVSVKATTNETIGFVGRKEGIAAIATASVVYGETL
ncbi:bifunctional 2-C-methyl-D-erythritol 4-phosphate cytidylyltransferase/2-C-methyl-D-erythritol 2,4-cyclodiphosphate synthase protein [Fulvimarina pelagi HTCC2506]|uniref:Bifunctional enzyme IspD/IspF n=1 Tax=Fulvimarina pelagi HTCC2506 TaxID=314231 RepID=Q0G7A5_9HYPH|nr:bifunctional 2-C-methyl-D-erythritol 4-phosphate cytidylyltransferase/2-C-methyl-D-erythritol 2,4-cyclodiphosphate synthase [Fulvimarina pelagi]EAU42459.1 bifunctional 2-C-methyl-D-erythritol 4-phosphate cytidylyltransferase/2-C-methyl-D-erythritol 2,4-cyclodiphosphate synthase protein [Fulvimarina pelagi HTCC2506]